MANRTYRCKVTRVIDGDTVDASIDLGFKIMYADRIRLMGLDTPESRTANKREKVLGLASKARLKELLSQAPVSKRGAKWITLETTKAGTGKFGRILGTLWIEDRNLNQALIDEGHARWYMGGSKDELGPWTRETGCTHLCGGRKLTRRRVCDGQWERWTPDGYIKFS
jgi:micrococcal nuclease|tara:strand:- start:5854 stop:6357 length:504 start_codon:yes stop_codon:yes gene_type:complete